MEYNKRGYKLKKPKESIPSLFLHDWKFFNGLDEITEGFNTFFVNIGSELDFIFQTPIHH